MTSQVENNITRFGLYEKAFTEKKKKNARESSSYYYYDIMQRDKRFTQSADEYCAILESADKKQGAAVWKTLLIASPAAEPR